MDINEVVACADIYNEISQMQYIERHAANEGFQVALFEAQFHAIPFYEKLGYVGEGEIFLDAGKVHTLMRRTL